MSIFARTTFIPSLAYNMMRNRWSTWNWFDRIDENVIIGALPFHGQVMNYLYFKENIRSMISMNEDFELTFGVTNRRDCELLGIEYLQLNTADIFHAPKLQQLVAGVDFIRHQRLSSPRELSKISLNESTVKSILFNENQLLRLLNWSMKNNGQYIDFVVRDDRINDQNPSFEHRPSTYLHCKAGRTRSATLAICYLIKQYDQTPQQAMDELKKLRRQVLLHREQLKAIDEYYAHYLEDMKKMNFC